MVSRVVFGRGSFNQLDEILAPNRKGRNAPFIFYVDDVFKGNHWLTSRIMLSYKDKIIYVPTDEEPKTEAADPEEGIFQGGRGALNGRRSHTERSGGACSSAYAGMSNDKRSENLLRRKPKVSWGR